MLYLPPSWFKTVRKSWASKPVLSVDQIGFLRGTRPAGAFGVWWPLLMAKYIRPNECPPPMFLTTAKGMAAVKRSAGEQMMVVVDKPRRTCQIILPKPKRKKAKP